MEFKKGFTIKPARINDSGKVFFTDGTTEVVANQRTCEAYGYKYNQYTGACEAISSNSSNLSKEFSNSNNSINGTNNKVDTKSFNLSINGTNNTSKGMNSNVLVNGNNNTIANGINNAAILSGSDAEAIRTGEVIVGSKKEDGLPDTSSGLSTFRSQTSNFHLYAYSDSTNPLATAYLSGSNEYDGVPMHINSLSLLEGSIIGSSEGLEERYMSTFTCSATCNANGVSKISSFTENVVINNIGNNTVVNVVNGTDANATSGGLNPFNNNHFYVVCGEGLFGVTKKITWTISIKLVEQIHELNTNILTN